MAFNKRTWVGRLGEGLNKYIIGALGLDGKQTITSAPDNVTQEGDALSAANLNDLEDRIEDEFDSVENDIEDIENDIEDIKDGTTVVGKAESDEDGNNIKNTYATKNALNEFEFETNAKVSNLNKRVTNLETKVGDKIVVDYPSQTYGNDEVPANVAPYAKVPTIKGKSRAWNQLVKNGNFADASAWAGSSFSIANNICTVTGTGSNVYTNQDFSDYKVGHKYIVMFLMKNSSSAYVRINTSNRVTGTHFFFTEESIPASSSWVFKANITQLESVTYLNKIGIIVTTERGETVDFSTLILRDLTLIFGAGNEPSTVAEALAQLPALGQYNAYDAGSLVSTEVSGVKTVRVNLFDEEVELGYINTSGEYKSSTTEIRSKNFISVLSATAYYIKNPNGFGLRFFDANENFVGLQQNVANSSFTTPANCTKLKFNFNSAYGITYNHNVQICLNSYADKTTYHPYKTDTLSLSEPVTPRGVGTCVETLDPETGVLDDGKFGSDNLGDLNWTAYSLTENRTAFYANISSLSAVPKYSMWAIPNAICPIALPTYQKADSWGKNVFVFTQESGTLPADCLAFIFDDTKYADATAFKNAMSGVYLMYEKETYTPSSPIAPITDNFIEVEGGGTVETIQTQTPVIDSVMTAEYLNIGA